MRSKKARHPTWPMKLPLKVWTRSRQRNEFDLKIMAKINTRSPKWCGWLPDLPDQRDFSYSIIKPRIAKLPSKVDLRSKCSPIENQGDIGACTAHALVGALEFLEIKDGCKFVDLSRLFVYYNERVIEGTANQDSGAFLRDGIKSLAKQGVCPEK